MVLEVQSHRRSIQPLVTAGLILGSILAAWFRFDADSVMMSWSVVMICIAGAVTGWLFQARRVPHIQLPQDVQELGTRTELTPEEEARFTEGLRAWHQHQQQNAWREIVGHGPGPLIRTRAVYYFLWLSLAALALLPPVAVPGVLLPQLPRFLIVQLPLAATALAIAAPLGIRDWRRAKKALTNP